MPLELTTPTPTRSSEAARPPPERQAIDAAKRHYDLAEALDELKGHTTVGPAILHLAKGELSRGEQKLKMIEAFNRNSVPAMLGQACAKFNGGNYRDALKLYREVFKHNPSPPPTVRLGLAYCYHKLGQTRMAQRALERGPRRNRAGASRRDVASRWFTSRGPRGQAAPPAKRPR